MSRYVATAVGPAVGEVECALCVNEREFLKGFRKAARSLKRWAMALPAAKSSQRCMSFNKSPGSTEPATSQK